MKKIIVVALLINLNILTMDCFEKDKPYKKYRNQILQTLDIDQQEYNDLKEIFKHFKRHRTHQPECLTGLINAISRMITFSRRYINQ